MFVESEALFELELELIQPHMAQKPVLRGEVGCACVAREVSVEKGTLCCGAPPQGLSNAPHDSGMCWKQFMMRLEDTWFVAAFHSNPMHDPGLREVQRLARVCVCKGASVLLCLLSCCCWRRRPTAVRRSRLRAAPPPDALVSPRGCRTKGLPMAKGALQSAAPPSRRSSSYLRGSSATVPRWGT